MVVAPALSTLDLSALLQFVFSALLILAGTIFLVKREASRHFLEDAEHESQQTERMSIGDGDSEPGGRREDSNCATCGNPGNKKCSGCKRVRYCSHSCQSKHWDTDHKKNCKQLKPSEKEELILSGNGYSKERKPSGFGPISLVPARRTCKVLQKPKKMLFPYDEFIKLFNWKNPGFPPCGLVNCGNSCFANVVLQCLTFTRPLAAFLLERDHSKYCTMKRKDWCFICELQTHIKKASKSREPFSPLNILSRLPKIGGNLGYGRQEDAHEFMRFSIDTMQSICLDEFGGERFLDPRTQETTLIQYIFGGHLQSQVTCTECGMLSNRYENMMDLTVEIQGEVESLEECLKQFTAREWLDGDNKYKCDGCNDYVRAWKRLTVHQAPNILTIALKRFQSGRFGKLNKRITFPEKLDLTPYMSSTGDGSDQYMLYAVVVHVDMLNASFFGHYICYTKDYYGQWYMIDDCKVMKVDVEDVLSEGAYMLLYIRTTHRRDAFVEPVQVKRLNEVITKEPTTLKVPNGSTAFSQLPTSSFADCADELLLVTGTANELATDSDSLNASKTVLSGPFNGKSVPVCEEMSDMDVDQPSSSSLADRESEVPSPSSCYYISERITDSVNMQLHSPEVPRQEVHVENGLEPCSNNTIGHQEGNGSNLSTESSNAASHPYDQLNSNKKNQSDCEPFPASFTVKSMVLETLNDTATLEEQLEQTGSRSDSAFKLDRINGAFHRSKGTTLSSSWDNDTSAKPIAEISHGLYNGTSLLCETNDLSLSHSDHGFAKKKSVFPHLFHDNHTRMRYAGIAENQNGSHPVDHVNSDFNGQTELGFMEQELLKNLSKGKAR